MQEELLRLQEAERCHQEEAERAEKEKQELTQKLEDMIQQESTLSAKVKPFLPGYLTFVMVKCWVWIGIFDVQLLITMPWCFSGSYSMNIFFTTYLEIFR